MAIFAVSPGPHVFTVTVNSANPFLVMCVHYGLINLPGYHYPPWLQIRFHRRGTDPRIIIIALLLTTTSSGSPINCAFNVAHLIAI